MTAARPDAPDLDHLDALAERLRDLTYRGRNMTGPEAATYARYLLPVVQQLAARERDRLQAKLREVEAELRELASAALREGKR